MRGGGKKSCTPDKWLAATQRVNHMQLEMGRGEMGRGEKRNGDRERESWIISCTNPVKVVGVYRRLLSVFTFSYER